MENEVRKNKRGRPTLFTSEIFAEVEKLARVFCASDESIAACLDVHPDTFRRWKRKHNDLCGVIEKGKLHAKKSVQEAIFRNAVEKNNLSAQIFILTNLWPDEWRDRRAIVNNTVVNRVSQGEQANKPKQPTPEEIAERKRLIEDFRRLVRGDDYSSRQQLGNEAEGR